MIFATLIRTGVPLMLVALGACSGPTAPESTGAHVYPVSGSTAEPPLPADTPPFPMLELNGVRIEVLTGPAAGSVVVSAAGRFSLPRMPIGSYQLRASKDGYQTVTRTFAITDDDLFGVNLWLYLGQAPHTVHGDIFNSRGGRVPFARVELIGGANAGRVTQANIDGRYRFDGLAQSGPFEVRATHEDFDGRTVQFANSHLFEKDLDGLFHHEYFGVSLTPRVGR